MQTKSKNGKLIGTMVLFLLLCVALLIGDRGGRKAGLIPLQQASATPTPEIPSELYNVWITETSKDSIRILHDGGSKEYPLVSAPGGNLSGCIADVILTEGVVTGITVKQDTIEAKVLRIGEDFVELEGYGVLPLEKESRVYRMYSDVEEVSWQEVLVGYTTSSFVVSGEKVCAAPVSGRGHAVLRGQGHGHVHQECKDPRAGKARLLGQFPVALCRHQSYRRWYA